MFGKLVVDRQHERSLPPHQTRERKPASGLACHHCGTISAESSERRVGEGSEPAKVEIEPKCHI